MKRQEFIAAATEIRILMGMLTKISRQELQNHLDACGVGISTLHHIVMRMLRHHPYTIKDLSKHMLVEPASLVPVIDELELKTLVRRTTDPHDRRRTPLILTEQGEQMLHTLPTMSPASSPFLRTLETMGDEKIADLLACLRELAEGVSDNKDMVAELSQTVRLQLDAKAVSTSDKKGRGGS